MVELPHPALYTIGLDQAFSDALVDGIIQQTGSDALTPARGMIILPNRRAVVAVRDAFVRRSGQAALFPRLVTLGDGDLNEAAGAALDVITPNTDPPAINPVLRRFRLASLISDVRPGTTAGNAMRLAQSIAALIDQMQIERLDPAEFMALADGDVMASHWERAFAMLKLVLARWPQELVRLGVIDRADARNRLWHQAAEQWRRHGLPTQFVVAAGISTSAPAIARLLRVIALSPGGSVVLPHFDREIDVEQWADLGDDPRKLALLGEGRRPQETHPQYHLKLLLERMGFHREEVSVWPQRKAATDKLGRVEFVRQMTTAADYTDVWPDLSPAQTALRGVHFYDLADASEEAQTIAIIMREALETPGRTAALVTADRSIARRVQAHLLRWGIEADDSAGSALPATAAGEFLLSLIEVGTTGLAPVPLMALLNHPFVAGRTDRLIWLDRVRELDLLLRGPRPAPGPGPITDMIAKRAARNAELQAWWLEVSQTLGPVADLLSSPAGVRLDTMMPVLRTAIDELTDGKLWTGADGRALASMFTELSDSAFALDVIVTPQEAIDVARQLMDDVIVRPPQGGHPRLFIWGLIESRLQRADIMILAGLNEGQWPQIPATDPWLAPMIRRRLGLPGNDRQIGLSAHDFGCALGAPHVIITRARKVDGTPTVPSRFRLRMEALLGDKRMSLATRGGHDVWARHADSPAAIVRSRRPALSVPPERRPMHLSVTMVDTLKADPFAFYARAGLFLSALDALDAEPTAAWRGTRVHDVMEQWLRGGDWSAKAMDQAIDALARRPEMNAALVHLWLPPLRCAARYFVDTMANNISDGRQPVVNATELRSTISHGAITLVGRPDRIDQMPDGSLIVVDYKTGSSPTKKAVDAAFALQLGLLGLMAREGAFTQGAKPVSGFEYWRTNRSDSGFGKIDIPFKTRGNPRMNVDNFIDEVTGELDRLIADYLTGDQPFVAKLVPEYAKYADYDQFMRLEEWIGANNEDMARDGVTLS